MKVYLFLFFSLSIFFLLVFPSATFASGFQLKTIGALNVNGVTYNHLWYTNSNVVFTGTALENAKITVTIDGASKTITADSSGNWSYSTFLSDGDHQISFTSNESTIAFTLTIGENIPEGIGGLPTAETPTVGTVTPTIVILSLGVLLVLLPLLLRKNLSIKNEVFVSR